MSNETNFIGDSRQIEGNTFITSQMEKKKIENQLKPLALELKKNQIHHIIYTTGETFEYPLKTEKVCRMCCQHFDTIPIFIPHNRLKNSRFVFEIFPYCSVNHAFLTLVDRKEYDLTQKLEWMSLYLYEYFGYIETKIPFLPLELMEDYSEFGVLSKDEYYSSLTKFVGGVLCGMFQTIPTFIEIKDIHQINEDDIKAMHEKRNNRILKDLKVKKDQQEEYTKNMKESVTRLGVSEQEFESQYSHFLESKKRKVKPEIEDKKQSKKTKVSK